MLDHKLATLAVMTTVAGAASVLEENADPETKSALGPAALILGGLYCLSNAEECAGVTTRILYFGSQIKAETDSITGITSRLTQKKSSLQERALRDSSLAETINKMTEERNSLQQTHDSLMCRFCI